MESWFVCSVWVSLLLTLSCWCVQRVWSGQALQKSNQALKCSMAYYCFPALLVAQILWKKSKATLYHTHTMSGMQFEKMWNAKSFRDQKTKIAKKTSEAWPFPPLYTSYAHNNWEVTFPIILRSWMAFIMIMSWWYLNRISNVQLFGWNIRNSEVHCYVNIARGELGIFNNPYSAHDPLLN